MEEWIDVNRFVRHKGFLICKPREPSQCGFVQALPKKKSSAERMLYWTSDPSEDAHVDSTCPLQDRESGKKIPKGST